MALNVRSEIGVNTATAEANLGRLVARFKTFGDVTEHTKNKIDILAHSFQALSLAYQGFNKARDIAGEFLKTADAINTMNARLQQTTTSTAHFTALRAEIDKIAKSTFSSSETISNLFINLNQSLSEMGLKILKFLDKLHIRILKFPRILLWNSSF